MTVTVGDPRARESTTEIEKGREMLGRACVIGWRDVWIGSVDDG
jgi:hypothetical protein